MPQNAQHLGACAHVSKAVVAAGAVVRTEAQIGGDLQCRAQGAVNSLAEGITAFTLGAYTGYAHQVG